MIAGVVTARNPGEALEKIKTSKFNLYEVRLDSFESFEGLEVLGNILKSSSSRRGGGKKGESGPSMTGQD